MTVFGIIWISVHMLVLPTFEIFAPLSDATRRLALLITVFVAAVAGSVYSLRFAQRERARLSRTDLGFYWLF